MTAKPWCSSTRITPIWSARFRPPRTLYLESIAALLCETLLLSGPSDVERWGVHHERAMRASLGSRHEPALCLSALLIASLRSRYVEASAALSSLREDVEHLERRYGATRWTRLVRGELAYREHNADESNSESLEIMLRLCEEVAQATVRRQPVELCLLYLQALMHADRSRASS